MPTVGFTANLTRFFPGLGDLEVGSATVAEAVRACDAAHPGLGAYIVDEHGALRKHVNIFVDDEMVVDRTTLSDPLAPGARVMVIQALSGG